MRLRLWMAALFAALPLIVFAAAMIVFVRDQQQTAIEDMLRQALDTAVRTVDQRIVITSSALEMLATRYHPDTGFNNFAELANRALNQRPVWVALEMRDRNGLVQLISQERDNDERLPPADEVAARVMATGRPAISGIIIPPNGAAGPLVQVSVPILARTPSNVEWGMPPEDELDGAAFGMQQPVPGQGEQPPPVEVNGVLTAYLPGTSIARSLGASGVPTGWQVALIDASQRMVARRYGFSTGAAIDDVSIGAKLPSHVIDAPRNHSGFFYANSQMGQRLYSLSTSSAATGWTVLVGAPTKPLDEISRQAVWGVTAGALSALLLAVSVSWLVANAIAKRERAERRTVALEAAQAAELRAADILESTTDGVFETDHNWRITFVNSHARRLIFHSRDVRGEDLWEALPNLTQSVFGNCYLRALADQCPMTVEGYYEPLNSWFAAHAYPSETGLAVYFQDITQRRLTEAALEEAMHRTSEVLDSIRDAFYAIDPDWRVVYVNARATELFKKSREEMLGKNFFELFPAIYQSVLHDAYSQVMADRQSRNFEAISPTLQTWNSFNVYPRAGGGVSVYFRDVSDRKKAESALMESEARYRSLVQAVPQLVWVCNSRGEALFLSPQWLDYTGKSENTQLGLRWLCSIHPEDLAQFLDRGNDARQNGQFFDCDARLRRQDGEYRWFKHRAVPLVDGDRDKPQWYGTSTDISDLVEASEVMRRSRDEAERAALSKSRFLASASHDLRQPMQSLFLFAGALQSHVTSQHGRSVLANLERGLEAMKGLLDSLLDVSRLDAGVVRPAIEQFDIHILIDHVTAGYGPIAEAKGLGLIVTDIHRQVRSDRTLLARILRNLLENAIRYTPEGEIEIGTTDAGDHLDLWVRDTGIGIAQEQQARVFEEFHQVGNPERDRDQGLGLGLAIVQRVSQLLGHAVTIQSTLGIGSTFTVSVPLAPDQQPAPLIEEDGEADVPDRTEAEKPFLVVIDDDAIVLMGMEAILADWGYQVVAVSSREQALQELRLLRQNPHAKQPDVIVADYRLRDGESGTSAILAVRKEYGFDIPGIIVTGETGPECQIDATLHGLDLLHKPVSSRQLSRAVERILAKDSHPSGS